MLLDKIYKNLSSILLMIIFVIMGIAQFIFYNQDIGEYRAELTSIETSRKDLVWSLINSTFDLIQISADEKSQILAKSIVSDIKDEYTDLTLLKGFLDTGNFQDTKLPYIVYKNIRNHHMFNISNSNNDCFVLSRDGVIMDTQIIEYGRSWHTFKEDKMVDAEALYLVFELTNSVHDNSIIYTTVNNNNSEDVHVHTHINYGNKDDIKKIFYESGIDGLKDITFFGKAYITETGDIFGTEDINTNSVRVNNHKLIVIQKFNIYDIIKYHSGKDIELNNKVFDCMKHEVERGMLIRSITYSALLILNIIAMFIIIFWSDINNRFKRDQ